MFSKHFGLTTIGLTSFLVLFFSSPATGEKNATRKPIKPFLLERTPTHIPHYQPDRTKYALNNDKLWKPGTCLAVAFRDGSDEERQKVVKLASEWTKYGNVSFEFSEKPGDQFREWDITDTKYGAHIRVSFEESGFWSAVGNDSIDRKQFPENKASMNLDIENCSEEELETSILHEFGHALGFLHEHQRPDGDCSQEFRWQDDPGYECTKDLAGMYKEDSEGRYPGIYTWCSGPPNSIPKEWIEKNMRSLPMTSAFILGPKDRHSIMHYHFPEFFFQKGSSSPCFCATSGRLSKYDIQGMQKAYPTN